jgi:aminopeptidase-like protein
MAILWILNFSDGEHDLLDIAVRSGFQFDAICEAARLLRKYELLANTG